MNILLADDHELFNEAFSLLLNQLFQDCAIKHTNNWPSAKRLAINHSFDLAILDLFMPAPNGWHDELAELMSVDNVEAVCILTSSLSQENINDSFALGVRGYIHKSSNLIEIRKALKLVLDGKIYLPTHSTQHMKGAPNYYSKLTARQHKILTMISGGRENKRIACELGIKESTVKRHVYNIFQQLGASNRTEAVHLARQHGLLQDA